jgi:hypothetical protein
MLQLRKLIGQTIRGVIPRMHPEMLKELKLRGVEFGGIWVESQELTNVLLKAAGRQTASRTPIVFLPYSEIALLVTSVEGASLSEKAFGL